MKQQSPMSLTTVYQYAQIPATYPVSNPELCIPELDGKTSKMYRCVFISVVAIVGVNAWARC